MENFKISANYWDKLSDKEKLFLQYYAVDYGVKYCKRILSLAKNFRWDDITNFSHYTKEKSELIKFASKNVWIIFRGEQMIGTITKTEGLGISERISIKTNGKLNEVWHNFYEKNPKKQIMQQIQSA